ncbi:hypothetical protein Tco_0757725, partial [Tanacetum coccineum]
PQIGLVALRNLFAKRWLLALLAFMNETRPISPLVFPEGREKKILLVSLLDLAVNHNSLRLFDMKSKKVGARVAKGGLEVEGTFDVDEGLDVGYVVRTTEEYSTREDDGLVGRTSSVC